MAEHPATFCRRLWRSAPPLLVVLSLILLLVPLIRGCALQGWLHPVRVTGASMAGDLYGPHYQLRCHDCGIEFRCGVEYLLSSGTAVCPNCGFAENDVPRGRPDAGRRVLIDRWPTWMQAPEPWQPIAYVVDEQTGVMAVKRVIAAGGGKVEIRDGDILLDGTIQQKSLAQLRDLMILVHDDRYRPRHSLGLPDRWRSSRSPSGWRKTDSGYLREQLPDRQQATIDWLDYTPWTCWPNPSPPVHRTTAAAIVDHYAYNQSLPRSSLSQVSDLLLDFQAAVRGRGALLVRACDGTNQLQLRIDYPGPRCQISLNGQPLAESDRRDEDSRDQGQLERIEFAICDQRVLVAIDRVVLFETGFEPQPQLASEPVPSLSIGAAGVEIEVLAPRIYRDIHYRGPAGETRWTAPQTLQPHQWFAIGDNVPASIDSRRYGPLEQSAIVGAVRPWKR